MSNMDWVDKVEKEKEEDYKSGYFNIQEGDNRIQMLTHAAPLPQVWDNASKKYLVAEEGAQNVSIKGVCWVLHEGLIKMARLPYTVVKSVRELMSDPDYSFEEFPMPRMINIKAKNAGTKEVEYQVIPAPKETVVPPNVTKELEGKPSPEEMIEKMKGKVSLRKTDYPTAEIDPDDIPF